MGKYIFPYNNKTIPVAADIENESINVGKILTQVSKSNIYFFTTVVEECMHGSRLSVGHVLLVTR